MPAFAYLRRKLADKILGNQTVLFTSKRNIDRIEAGEYLELPDDVLGAMTRRWFHAIEEAHEKRAKERERPVSTMIAEHAVLALATYVQEVGAETANFTLKGSIDGGKTEHVFRVDFYLMSDDYPFTTGVEKEFAADDPEKLTKISFGFDNPEYDAWKAGRAREREPAWPPPPPRAKPSPCAPATSSPSSAWQCIRPSWGWWWCFCCRGRGRGRWRETGGWDERDG